MSKGHITKIIEYLVWCVVCMELSVPLMATNYLRLRTNFYVAVSQCYYYIQQPIQAEVFARRALDKVNELAKLEHQSASELTPESRLAFTEATVKLGILIFKRSVFESRKKVRVAFKFKVRPSIKDMLQAPHPRFPTEKLLYELFPGKLARFLAVLETLIDFTRRPLYQAPPPRLLGCDLDHDVVLDIYQVSLVECRI